MGPSHIILSSLPYICAKNYQSWWSEFDEVVTKTIYTNSFMDPVHNTNYL